MYTRDKSYYDIVAHGLAAMGYESDGESTALTKYIQDMFANKYNAQRTFAQVGFSLNPNIPINPTYEQIEATIRPYTMAGYVDIDSDGPTKSTDGLSLRTGGLPTFKHEVTLNRKMLREQMLLADKLGKFTPDMVDVVMELFFKSVDDLLGGNYNTMLYQRHQIVSNECKLVINSNNNPLGVAMTLEFDGVVAGHKKTSTWYTKSGDTVTEDANIGTTKPLQVLKKVRRDAEDKDFCPLGGHWEVSKTTWDDVVGLPYFRKLWVNATRPDVSDATVIASLGSLATDETIKRFIEGIIGAPIVVIDSVSSIEKFNKATGKIEYSNVASFKEGVFVYVPGGELGDVQFGRPIFMETPGSRAALYDGGRTLIRNVFNDENMNQYIKSEVTGLVVPNKTRWMYYVTVKG